MIFPFELSKINFLVKSTNCLLTFEIDSSIYDKFKESLIREINFLEANTFENDLFEPSYKEFNEVIKQCIDAIKNRLESLSCGQVSNKTIVFDDEKYQKRVYHI